MLFELLHLLLELVDKLRNGSGNLANSTHCCGVGPICAGDLNKIDRDDVAYQLLIKKHLVSKAIVAIKLLSRKGS